MLGWIIVVAAVGIIVGLGLGLRKLDRYSKRNRGPSSPDNSDC